MTGNRTGFLLIRKPKAVSSIAPNPTNFKDRLRRAKDGERGGVRSDTNGIQRIC